MASRRGRGHNWTWRKQYGTKRSRGDESGCCDDGVEMHELSPMAHAESFMREHVWTVPDGMVTSSEHQPYASPAARARLIERLLSGSDGYRCALQELSATNPVLCSALNHTVKSATDVARERRMARQAPCAARTSAAEPSDADVRASARHALRLEFLVSVMLRMRNQTIPAFLNVCLSLKCLKCGLPRELWSMLSELRIIFSYGWTKDLALEIGAIVSQWPSSSSSRSIGFAVADNCAYMIKLSFEHVDHDGEFLQTVNWLSYPIRAADPGGEIPELPGARARTNAALAMLLSRFIIKSPRVYSCCPQTAQVGSAGIAAGRPWSRLSRTRSIIDAPSWIRCGRNRLRLPAKARVCLVIRSTTRAAGQSSSTRSRCSNVGRLHTRTSKPCSPAFINFTSSTRATARLWWLGTSRPTTAC